jgi:hypothetical protein
MDEPRRRSAPFPSMGAADASLDEPAALRIDYGQSPPVTGQMAGS